MSQIRKLAGQTAYYGISSILARVLNFLLLPIWTERLDAAEYGQVNYLYTFTALFLVLYTFGMETAFFRFSSKSNDDKVYHSSATAIILISTLLSGILYFGADKFSFLFGEDIAPIYIEYVAIILFIDAAVAIPFAKLRKEEKALKFAVIKTIVVSTTIIFNLLLIIIFPDILAGKYLGILEPFIRSIFSGNKGIEYIFIANILANLLYLPLLWKEFSKLRLRIEWATFKPMFYYAIPLFAMGLAGIFNEQGYNIIMKNVYPESLGSTGAEALGKFGGAVKLSVIMMLGVQAFRYAAEPFFFNHADNKQAPELFAKIMHYFVVFNVVILVAIGLNIDLISDIFLRRPEYKEALFVLPILLLAKLFYGIYVNLSVWFKIKDKTIFGTYFAGAGALITVAGNILLIPAMGYIGSALTSLTCYILMSALCYKYGVKYFPVPYRFGKLFIYILIGLAIVYSLGGVQVGNQWLQYGFDLVITLLFAGIMFLLEGRSVNYKTKRTA
ncbi:lipopolysaccharide biosynthesis protein [Roseivirga pacifica]|uniref:lipopolysaccharide biosynthesis protein n=1 Tax=Roseivirga pacifica TaxID=1267423 RepID=UPI002095E119|nr:oligosaccharide flippase family protein [Roseivirga pacifica]MCO6357875.1 oligosaccharide flippase family protein [Roseivirga pacifica]MCO6366127.1 oligosaccharide flippase family protein [Roseivirga pacifica]MCO6371455.1 oligosaccharide flippase family protein [Roseivirga pacifica]MCO6375373.1 oligosaccharide flippase family protein [Roseivirga pacifica]MCO6378833.1 oligosaccharide flippase family protein [Roseivirga pacifica]